MGGRCEVILVRGNHDRGFGRDFGGLGVEVVDSWEGDGYVAAHGDTREFHWPEGAIAVLGHWHPAASLKDAAGARLRYPAFLVWPEAIVLPAFSPFSKGLDIRRGIPPDLRELVGNRDAPQCVAVTPREAIWLKRDSSLSRNSSLSGASKGGGLAPRKIRQAKKSESSRC
jgi:metallophosphoesterase superfamily enzyme